METPTMGKVLVTAMIENLEDLYNVKRGTCCPTTRYAGSKSRMP